MLLGQRRICAYNILTNRIRALIRAAGYIRMGPCVVAIKLQSKQTYRTRMTDMKIASFNSLVWGLLRLTPTRPTVCIN